MATSGLTLRVERTAARVGVQELARRMGRSRATVHRYEGLAVVPAAAAAEYRAALATFSDDANTANSERRAA